MRMILTLVVALAIPFTSLAFAQSELRYVVPNTSKGGGYMLWTDYGWFRSCVGALTRGTPKDQKTFCTDGFNGLKPHVGELAPGTTVERLDTPECRDWVKVRVGTGPLAGKTGCIAADALTSIKPEPATAAAEDAAKK